MGLIDKLRQSEERGRDAAPLGMEKARAGRDDAERRLRRKMRLHPRMTRDDVPQMPAPAKPPVSSGNL
jgi:hypothetical protein